ncbi:MAG: PAS domain-containing protein/CheY-like chemotaxis protein [Bacteriovoracaceae bacterium]|jgi:PAS domain-containing protein/CheY-like chemotaxis protein
MEKRNSQIYFRLLVWGLGLLLVSGASFHINSRYEQREADLIVSLEIVKAIKSNIVGHELSEDLELHKEERIKKLRTLSEKIPKLKRLVSKESFGEKYFNESKDLNISFQQYVFFTKKEGATKYSLNFRKLKRELDGIEGDIFEEVKKISLDKILWSGAGDLTLILLALIGAIALALHLKEDFANLLRENKNLSAKLESNLDSIIGGEWSINLEDLYLDLGAEAISILNVNIYEPHISLESFLDYFIEESSKELNDHIKQCNLVGDSFSVEIQKRGESSDSSWLLINGVLVEEGEVRKIVGRISDIDEIHKSEDRFELLFENIEQPAFIAGETGLWDCNNAALRFFKLRNKEDFLDKKLPELFPLLQNDGSGSLAQLKQHMRKGQKEDGCRFGWTFRNSEGVKSSDVQLFPIMMNGNSLYLYVLKEESGHVSVIRDNKYRALICDPQVNSRNILMGYFEEEGWQVRATDSMAEALSLKEEVSYDVIVLDFSIKDLNIDLFKLNQNKTALVGIGGIGKEDEVKKEKVDHFIHKPIMKEVILRLISKVNIKTDMLVVEDVLDLYIGKFDMLTSYCNELEIYLEEFEENFERDLEFKDWSKLKEHLLTLQIVSKKFSCRGLNLIFDKSFEVLKSKNISKIREDKSRIHSSFNELISNLRAELGNRAA